MESPPFLNCLLFFIVRPLLAISFVVSFVALWWVLAWKLVLSHVPLYYFPESMKLLIVQDCDDPRRFRLKDF
ncbi:hypothetical protein HA466_0136910 [Hirschfeldia incana]|nr:hypothetical protein HA466_0136910 [Hirschfeldia incana]